MVKDVVVPKPFHCKRKLHVIPYLKVSFRGKVIRTQESLVHYITFDGIYFYMTHPMDNLCGYFIIQTIFLFSKMTSQPQIWTPGIMTFLHSFSIGITPHAYS